MNKKYWFLLNPIYWPVWCGFGILWLIIKLPVTWQLFIGKILGKILYVFPSKLKQTTKINIDLCFPEWDDVQKNKLIEENFASLGIALIESGMAWWLPEHKLRQKFTIHGLEYVNEAFNEGKGIILLGPHFTCLEIVGRLVSLKHKFAVMYRPHKKAFIAFLHEYWRKHDAIKYIPRTRLRSLLQILQNNEAIWYAYDIDGGKRNSIFAPLFGIQTASLTTVSRIVELTGAKIIPISFYRVNNSFNYEIFLKPALQKFPSGDLLQDATRLNELVEIAIRNKPEQYLWQYKRFKTRPAATEKRFY